MNKIIITGRLTNNPQAGETTSKINFSRFTIACQRRQYANNQDPVVDFIPCTAWRNNADFANNYLEKGALVLVEGSLQSSKMPTKDGGSITVYSINVDTIEGLETRKTAQLRKQTQNTSEIKALNLEEENKKVNSNPSTNNLSNTPKDTADTDDDWSVFDDIEKW